MKKKKKCTSHGPTLITSVFFPRKKESPCGEAYIQSVKANRVPIPIKTGTSVRQGFDAQCLHPLMILSRFTVSEERFHYRTGSKWASRITVQRDSHEITKTGGGFLRDLNPFITAVRCWIVARSWSWTNVRRLTERKNVFWWFSIHAIGDIFWFAFNLNTYTAKWITFSGAFYKMYMARLIKCV